MQYALVLAGALLAAAQPHQNEAHARLHRHHHKRDVVTEVDELVVTVTDVVTAGGPAPTAVIQPAAVSSAAPSAVQYHAWSHSSAAAPSSVAPAPSSYVAPTPSSYVAPAPSSYVAPSSSVSSAIASSSYSSIASSVSSSAPSASGISASNLTPNGKKRGLSGYVGIQSTDAFKQYAPHISWYSDYTPNTPDAEGVMGIGMLWGADGSACGSVETERLATFSDVAANSSAPSIMFGFYEPDCQCPMSADMSTSDAATQWDALLAPLKSKGTILGSPSMCKQKDEDFLTPFKSAISTDWDVTSIHINKPDLQGAKDDVEYYVQKYGKPVWVSEFACVNDEPSWQPCTDQTQINSFINDVVSYFEGNDNVVAYGPSNGAGLGDVWPLTDSNTGELTASGQTYLNAISSL
ncbi:hypothetical protein LTR62_006480 [Meristemomyces frigidus]|uniref:Asl1-like glycosyl hydrolase catalytic domain-containing protein n=1 Tax=Meristemomyces frigidus TaxID=1508187 RepID=A0AAN7TCS8_9PEZI|nr:hypothetical protein LTR62_006480 [Meristemomyces frigidus]